MSLPGRLFDGIFALFARPAVLRAWHEADINRWNRGGGTLPCPWCGSADSAPFYRAAIDGAEEVGHFDADPGRLALLYGRRLPRGTPARVRRAFAARALRAAAGRSYVDYLRCSRCGLVFQNFPVDPAARSRFYERHYRGCAEEGAGPAAVFGRAGDAHFVGRKEAFARYFLERTGLALGAAMLDVGCAEGIVCRLLQERGIAASGIDPSAPMTNFARRNLGLQRIACGPYNAEAYPPAAFDGIIAHHVAEHVVDLRGFLAALAHHLKPGGYLLLQTPCLDDLRLPEDWRRVFGGGHLMGFSAAFLKTAVAAHDFEIVECRTAPSDLTRLEPEERLEGFDRALTAWGDLPCTVSILAQRHLRSFPH